jgi:hypothetical protein
VDAVVNVTGPDCNPARSACPLVQSLVEQGLWSPTDSASAGARTRTGAVRCRRQCVAGSLLHRPAAARGIEKRPPCRSCAPTCSARWRDCHRWPPAPALRRKLRRLFRRDLLF